MVLAQVFLALLYPYAQFYLADEYTVVYPLASPPVIVNCKIKPSTVKKTNCTVDRKYMEESIGKA